MWNRIEILQDKLMADGNNNDDTLSNSMQFEEMTDDQSSDTIAGNQMVNSGNNDAISHVPQFNQRTDNDNIDHSNSASKHNKRFSAFILQQSIECWTILYQIDQTNQCPTCGQFRIATDIGAQSNGSFRLNQFAILDRFNANDLSIDITSRTPQGLDVEMLGDTNPTDVELEYDLEVNFASSTKKKNIL